MKKEITDILNIIAQTIFDKKGFNILALDVRDISTLTDYIIIAEGNVSRHVQALANMIDHNLAKENIKPYKIEGKEGGDWVVLDFVDIIIHLFIPSIRQKYQLEKLYQKAEIVDLDIKVENIAEESL